MRILNTESLCKQIALLPLAALLLLATLVTSVFAQQATTPKSLQVGGVDFIGLRRLTQEHALALSGVQPGEPFTEAAIEEAARRLMDSGLFARLGFRVKSTGNLVQVTFQVEEADRALPIVFDNFVWFNEEELFAAIRREIPHFNGLVPESGSTAEAIAKALQHLLTEKKIAGSIEHMPEEDLSHRLSYLYSVKGVPLPVCTLRFPGASGIPEDELRTAAKQLTERDYSKTSTATFASLTLFQLYRHVGRLRARFNEPSAVLQTPDSPACKGGLTLTIPVEEGAVYSWDKAEWSGNQAVSATELDAALDMKSGEVADGLKIDKGLKAVSKALGHKGYIAARVKPNPTFDEPKGRVSFKFDVAEGAQYHMGTLRIVGLNASDTERVKEKWSLAEGAVYDAAWVDEFLKKGLSEALSQILASGSMAGRRPDVRFEIKPDRQKLTVDVTISIK